MPGQVDAGGGLVLNHRGQGFHFGEPGFPDSGAPQCLEQNAASKGDGGERCPGDVDAHLLPITAESRRTSASVSSARSSSSARATSAARANATGTDGSQPRPQGWENLMAEEVPRVGEVLVRRVFHMRDPVIGGPGPKLLPADVEERPDDRAVPGIDAGQPAGPGAAQQPQQHRLRLIVARVPDRHAVGAECLPATLQGGVSEPPGGILCRQSLRSRHTEDVDTLDMGRQVQPDGQRLAKRLIALRVGPAQLVVHVHDPRYARTRLSVRAPGARRAGRPNRRRRKPPPPPACRMATGRIAGSRATRRRSGSSCSKWGSRWRSRPRSAVLLLQGDMVPVQGLEPRTPRI